jgi:hypothetical protein
MNMKIVVCALPFLLMPGLAQAGIGTNGVVQCWNKKEDEISVSCNIKQASDGGGEGYCIVSTFREGWGGPQVNWILEGRIRLIGGSHPIAKKEKSLSYAYSPGEFGCVISPPPGYTYTAGDCAIDKDSAAKRCIVSMQSAGSNRYYEATILATPQKK